MKAIYTFIICTVFCLAAAACSKDDEQKDIKLAETEVATSVLSPYNVEITQGSGHYRAEIDNNEIADVSIEPQDTKTILAIAAKKNGTATITVKDTETNRTAKCLLLVRDDILYFNVNAVKNAVEAESMESEILMHMQQNSPYTEGCRYALTLRSRTPVVTGTWTVKEEAGNGDTISEGTFLMKDAEGIIPESYFLIWGLNNGNILDSKEITFIDDMNGDKESLCHLLHIKGPAPRINVSTQHYRIYEDLTEYYKELYPEAGVTGAVRVYICNFSRN